MATRRPHDAAVVSIARSSTSGREADEGRPKATNDEIKAREPCPFQLSCAVYTVKNGRYHSSRWEWCRKGASLGPAGATPVARCIGDVFRGRATMPFDPSEWTASQWQKSFYRSKPFFAAFVGAEIWGQVRHVCKFGSTRRWPRPGLQRPLSQRFRRRRFDVACEGPPRYKTPI